MATAAALCAALPVTTAQADPADPVISAHRLAADPVAADGSRITDVTYDSDRHLTMKVYSAAMDKDVTVLVQRPADTSVPRPVLYLLNGNGGGVDLVSWETNTDVLQFLNDKNVNVVTAIGGASSYYTDWQKPDPVLGVNKWKTFFTEELPPLIDAALATDGTNAIAAISMTETSILQLAEAKPGLYRALGAYSGCAGTSDHYGRDFVKTVVEFYGGGDVRNMWGEDDDPMWQANDPLLHAEGLRGMKLYFSTGTGMPGVHDNIQDDHIAGPVGHDPVMLADQIVIGGLIEAGVNWCTHNLQTTLGQLNIPATFDFQPNGTHSWGYWEDEFKKSWPVLADGLGI
ncbi:alpha/beta hydrolase [Nocardia stercoris]|uniref:alpha/beta hydrolase n=1 Tax=Nocardia stercoris TaxID=2483361 RepID=UPI0026C3BFE6